MPRGDRTGPWGAGPMTGRAAGYCAGYPVPGYMNPWGGRFAVGLGVGRGGFPFGGGRGRAWGGGRGWAWRSSMWDYPAGFYGMPPAYPQEPYQQPSPEQEIEFLKKQAAAIEEELAAITDRIDELKKSEKEEK